MNTSEKAIVASPIRSARRARPRHLEVALVAFTIAAAVVAWLLAMDMPAQPSPLVPFFTTMVSSPSNG